VLSVIYDNVRLLLHINIILEDWRENVIWNVPTLPLPIRHLRVLIEENMYVKYIFPK